jgi:hypothetical protein
VKSIKKVILAAVLVALLFVGVASADCQVGLTTKDPNNNYVTTDTGKGKLDYDTHEFWFDGHFKAGVAYSLISYKEPFPGDGSVILGTGTADGNGWILINSTTIGSNNFVYNQGPPDNGGAKIWLIPTADIISQNGNIITAINWDPTEFLFEDNLIFAGSCTPIPTPEFPTLAVPAAMIVGLIGMVVVIRERNKL